MSSGMSWRSELSLPPFSEGLHWALKWYPCIVIFKLWYMPSFSREQSTQSIISWTIIPVKVEDKGLYV
jgi:hypothetical protein